MLDASTPPDFEVLFTATSNPCVILDRTLNIVAANDAFLAMTGTTRAGIVGRNVFNVFPADPESEDKGPVLTTALLQRILEFKRPNAHPLQRHDLQVAGGGFEKRFWHATSVPILGSDGEVRWIVYSVQDATEFAQVGQAVRQGASPTPTPEQREILEELQPLNHVLRGLDDHLFHLLAEHLSPVILQAEAVLSEPGAPQKTIYFPFGGLVSMNRIMEDGATPAVAYPCSTGLIGVSAAMGTISLEETRVLIGGPALQIDADILQALAAANPALRPALCREAVPLHLAQVSSIAACAGLHSLDQRLARWLLTAVDSTGSRFLPVRQETIAENLGVRRTGVSEALGRLRAAHLLSTARNRIIVAERTALERRACVCHAVLKEDVASLFRSPLLEPAPNPAHIAALFAAYEDTGSARARPASPERRSFATPRPGSNNRSPQAKASVRAPRPTI